MLPATAPINTPFKVGENFDDFVQYLGELEESVEVSRGVESKAGDEFSVVMVLSITNEKEYLA